MVQHKLFKGVELAVANPKMLAAFYETHFGMKSRDTGEGVEIFFDRQLSFVRLLQASKDAPPPSQALESYSKIGVTLPDVDVAARMLTDAGFAASAPHQFEDIGYMSHLRDPEGFQIELLQHTFLGQPKTSEGDKAWALGGGTALGQVTLRTSDIERDLALYRDTHGMRLLSIQPVRAYGFDLYFLTHSDDTPPNED